ncbi:MAG: EpsI family protein [Sphingopyxis sp.]|uniref:exosortase-associated protein EpsI, V-type n=1 Tax=Sphingopyxis sp. TaxID=1908224 RepID=UPI001A56BF4D|nr:exosortase-associated protein EpsI, V-type [Sphingopyxis sp.]MBL9068876.1 EpsI family protein [Sphingopyxis sp.]
MPDDGQTARSGGISRRNALIGGVLACASGFAFLRQPAIANPAIPEAAFEKWVPDSFGRWSSISQAGVVLPPPDSLRDRLYDNLVTRVYSASGSPSVMMLLAYNNVQDGVLQVHRPEVCYPVGGFQLSDTRAVDVEVSGRRIPANFFTATGPDRLEQVQYFTRLGDAFPRTWAEQRLAVIRANLAGDIPDGMMMRVSTLGIGANEAETLLDNFTRAFILHSNSKLQHLLLGGSSSKGPSA